MRIRSYPYPAKLMVLFSAVFLLLLGFAPSALLPEVAAQTGNSDLSWQATYWNNVTLTGAPVLQQSEASLNYDWGAGSPDARVRSDRFSARWTRTIYVDAGSYRFDATSDDGVRVYVDNVRIINAWFNHGAQTFSATRNLAAGYHQLTVYYYDNTGPALVSLTWSQISKSGGGAGSGQGWRAEYYNNRDLTGAPALVRTEGQPNQDWGNNSPAAGVNADNFSARWTQAVQLPIGNYRFRVTVDDGARLWVNNQLLIDAWRVQAPTTYTGDIALTGGSIAIRLEYFDNNGAASVRLDWARSDQAPPTPTNTPPISIANWRGEYYNNRDLNGAPALVRDDGEINFDWGNNSPAGSVNNDNFSARWTRSMDFAAGRYRFHVTVDDGARLWVNNQLIIDAWRDQALTTFDGDIDLPGGTVPIRLEYYEHVSGAAVHLTWERIGGTSGNSGGADDSDDSGNQPDQRSRWQGDYFNNRELSGEPAYSRRDRDIDFDWGKNSPAPGINADNFSVRWTTTFDFDSGNYRFTTQTDDGVRLYIDGKLVINQWRLLDGTRYTYETNIDDGRHEIRVEYFDAGGDAFARFYITPLGPDQHVGNLITCVPPQPANYAWIKLYRLDDNNKWVSISRGIGSIQASGFLKIDGLPIDINRFGSSEPYRVEQWINGKVVRSVGNTAAGEPEFRLRQNADNYTPWQCK